MTAFLPSTTPTKNWPKSYLLDIYAKAVTHGAIFIEPIDKDNALSLGQRLYRARRRSDAATAAFILPEYHLVTVGEWISDGEGSGRLPIIFNTLPEGQTLPNIRPADPHELSAIIPTQRFGDIIPEDAAPAPKPAFVPATEADLSIDAEDIASYVERLRHAAQSRQP